MKSQRAAEALSCDRMALSTDEREQHFTRAQTLFGHPAVRVDSLPDGLSIELPGERFAELCEFVERERKCCPFLAFAMTIPGGGAPITLQMTGPAGTRQLLQSELHAVEKSGCGCAS
jgi:hypothetical protein